MAQSNSTYDVIVIGAGQAGLSSSYFLKQNNLDHIVFERGRIGETWLSQRWDSFKLNTPDRINLLPGFDISKGTGAGFSTANDFASALKSFVSANLLPVEENTKVVSMDKSDKGYFRLTADHNGNLKEYTGKKVVVASGCMNEVRIPQFANKISPDIMQVHAGGYRNSWQLPEGGVLVAGSGQSGVQIAEDLMDSGRDVYFSTSKVPRVPRRYRGDDITSWMIKINFFDMKTDDVTEPTIFNLRQPQISGVGKQGHTLSLQYLAKHGVKIFGKLNDAENDTVHFRPDASDNVKYADGFSAKFKEMVDEYIMKNGLSVPGPDEDFADEPDINASCASDVTSLNLLKNNITSIVWTTGFGADYSWMKLPAFEGSSKPKHKDGVSNVAGLYYVGLPWLRKRKSAIIYGINEDAEYICCKLM